MVTWKPAFRKYQAAEIPAKPPPMIATWRALEVGSIEVVPLIPMKLAQDN
ncbi:MAG: hypothetical protein ACUVQG_05410 [Thermogutta sp.]